MARLLSTPRKQAGRFSLSEATPLVCPGSVDSCQASFEPQLMLPNHISPP